MRIQIFGTGCAKCNQLYSMVQQAIETLGIDAQAEKVTDVMDIVAAGVMLTPALAVNGKILLSGKLPASQDQLCQLLREHISAQD